MSIFRFFQRADPLANTSADFREFYRNFISVVSAADGDLAREGLNESVIAKLTPDERIEAERLLLERLGAGGDSRTAIGLGLLGSRKAGTPLRVRMAVQDRESFPSPAYAEALWRIERDPRAVDALVAMARNPQVRSSPRVDAVCALSEMPSDVTRQALMEILWTEPDYLLRYHSFKGILMLHGYPWKEANDHAGKMAPQIGGALARPEARRAVLARLEELTAGRTLVTLDP